MGIMDRIRKAAKSGKSAIQAGAKKYKEWEAAAPERQAKELKRLEAEKKKLSVQARIAGKKEEIRAMKAKINQNNPFLSGGGMFGGDPFAGSPFASGTPVTKSAPRKKKKAAKRLPKRVEYY